MLLLVGKLKVVNMEKYWDLRKIIPLIEKNIKNIYILWQQEPVIN
jgi:hypothetical protein